MTETIEKSRFLPSVLRTDGSDICPAGTRYAFMQKRDICLRHAICSLRERGQISYRIERGEIYRVYEVNISRFAVRQNISLIDARNKTALLVKSYDKTD